MNTKVKVKYNGCPSQGGIQWMFKSRWYTMDVQVKVVTTDVQVKVKYNGMDIQV
jgi:hypothetical protein